MMAREFYDISVLNWIFRSVGAIPVDRSGRDLAATRMALRALAGGRVLGVFPEGRIEPTTDLLPFQTGVALMAIKTGAAVYPAYLDGTQRNQEMLPAYLSSNRARLAFGPAVEFGRDGTAHEQLQSATDRIRAAVERLRTVVRAPATHQSGTADPSPKADRLACAQR